MMLEENFQEVYEKWSQERPFRGSSWRPESHILTSAVVFKFTKKWEKNKSPATKFKFLYMLIHQRDNIRSCFLEIYVENFIWTGNCLPLKFMIERYLSLSVVAVGDPLVLTVAFGRNHVTCKVSSATTWTWEVVIYIYVCVYIYMN